MKEDEDNEKYDGGGLKGPLYWLAGVATAAVAGQNGMLGNIFGGPRPGGPGAPVSREVMDLVAENNRLKAEKYTDRVNAPQLVINAQQQAKIECLQRQVDQLLGMTQLTIPNANLNPGYGNAVVTVAPPPAPAPDVAAIVAATVAAMQKSQTTTTTNP